MSKPDMAASSQPSRTDEGRHTGMHAVPVSADPQAGRVPGLPSAPEDANQAKPAGDTAPPQGPGEEPGEEDDEYVPL
jgi:hypothetical protein